MRENALLSSPPAEPSAALLDVRAVAKMLGCSSRHIYRLSDAGRMPPPVKLGALVRWNRDTVATWIAGGCQPFGADTAKGVAS